jgi:hypothetical protein
MPPVVPVIDRTRNFQAFVVVVLGLVYAVIIFRHETPPPMLSQAFVAALGTFVAGRGYSASQKGSSHEQA